MLKELNKRNHILTKNARNSKREINTIQKMKSIIKAMSKENAEYENDLKKCIKMISFFNFFFRKKRLKIIKFLF